MGMFRIFRRKDSPEHQPANGHGGYFPLQDAPGRAWDDDDDDGDLLYRSGKPRSATPAWADWDSRLAQLDRSVAVEERKRQPWWTREYWQGRRKRWWAARIVAAIIALFIVLVAWLAITAPLSKSLQPIAPPQVTLLASDGTPIARNGAVVEAPVDVSKLPPHVVEAFLATEDRRFYSHWGVDPRGIARAAFTGTGGGSTITQQLAKFTFLTPERSLTRKAREALIAFWLEAWLTKDEILERYLSNAYFGDNMYGLRAASLHYFYRQPENLKPNQAAMLAGLLQAPSAYAPTEHYDRAERRMQLVVKSMVAAGYITEAEAKAMKPPRLDVRNLDGDLPTGTYFADWALPEARTLSDVGYSRQTLTTTLDSRLQEAARQAISRARLGNAQVALVAMHPNGEVVAMIGGKDYAQSAFNRATQAQRQPGSTFKLFVYLAALDAGMHPDDTIDGSEITEGAYRPKNAEGKYQPTITLADAFAHSSNVAAVRLQQQIGSKAVIAMARQLGVTSDLADGDPSLALGTSTMNLLELTAAYAGVAGNSFPVKPTAFPVKDPGFFGRLFDGKDSFSSRTESDMNDLLRKAVNEGTGRAAKLSIPNYGKTGTTQDHRDALFVGYAGDLVVGVWVGNDDDTAMPGVYGGTTPARIWRDFMTQAIGKKVAPRPTSRPNPQGPVKPLDVADVGDIPLGDSGATLNIDGEGATINGQIDGEPVGIRIDGNGVQIQPAPSATPQAAPP
ncbi:penicillin-binding protein [Altererythrobacter salegens]|uniref:Penicillin-binding protein n=1 Tax=Croceibacterium salegens TaxID=1737568 RepID=A0A6I4SZL0_9SPHN|nr:transglycosylase domain-containing protein [Croceibacterium salegens]MXO60246.1 penicillin-binding protein [Croceibacterium salegens]